MYRSNTSHRVASYRLHHIIRLHLIGKFLVPEILIYITKSTRYTLIYITTSLCDVRNFHCNPSKLYLFFFCQIGSNNLLFGVLQNSRTSFCVPRDEKKKKVGNCWCRHTRLGIPESRWWLSSTERVGSMRPASCSGAGNGYMWVACMLERCSM